MMTDFLRKMQFYSFIKNIDKILSSFNPDSGSVCENLNLFAQPKQSGEIVQQNLFTQAIKETVEDIGFDYLKVIHVNDSKNTLGAHKDRHENIGFGNLGFETVMKVFNDERFKDIPKILETPYVASLDKKQNFPPYKFEIAMIKSGVFDEQLIEKIRNQ